MKLFPIEVPIEVPIEEKVLPINPIPPCNLMLQSNYISNNANKRNGDIDNHPNMLMDKTTTYVKNNNNELINKKTIGISESPKAFEPFMNLTYLQVAHDYESPCF